MNPKRLYMLAAAIVALGITAHAQAGGLRVAPISLKMTQSQPSTTVRIWNESSSAIGVQVRIFSWRIVDGKDVLEPTRNVIASPPLATLPPGGQNVIRIVRVAGTPVRATETYRLLIDQLPNTRQRAGTVNVLVRQALAVSISP